MHFGIELNVIFPLAAREPAHLNGYGPLSYKIWRPVAYILTYFFIHHSHSGHVLLVTSGSNIDLINEIVAWPFKCSGVCLTIFVERSTFWKL